MMMDSVKVGFGGGLTNGQLMVGVGSFWKSFGNHSMPKSPRGKCARFGRRRGRAARGEGHDDVNGSPVRVEPGGESSKPPRRRRVNTSAPPLAQPPLRE